MPSVHVHAVVMHVCVDSGPPVHAQMHACACVFWVQLET